MKDSFRIWDDYNKKYVDKYNIDDYFISSKGCLGRVFDYDWVIYKCEWNGELEEYFIIEYSTGHKDINKQEWHVNDWTVLDDYCIGILVYDDEMSCFGFNIHEGVDIINYDESIFEFEPLYYYNIDEMVIEGNIHKEG